MKQLSYYAVIGLLIAPMFAFAEVGVSINVGQPGFYGQIHLGDAPRPQLIYSQPRMIYRGPVNLQPIYLHVPPRHARNWRSYCGRYNACRRPVYFVRDSWYDTVYVPYHRETYVYRDKNRSRDWNNDDHRGRNNDRHNKKYDKRHGHDNGKGNGHGKNH